jgi:osmotically-inducible protein OsmY
MMKTDTQLQKDVMAELQFEPAVNATHIGVAVDHSVVTLSGHVNSFSEKWDAERAAQRVAGVKALAVEITVSLPSLSERSDADIARAAETALEWLSFLPSNAVHVLVEKGWVTLTGQVNWSYQRLGATTAVRFLMGVRGVSNQIAVKPVVISSTIQSDIEAALQRRALSESHKVSVTVHGDEVTLSGTVHNWSERAIVQHAAWQTSGVRNVINNLSMVA